MRVFSAVALAIMTAVPAAAEPLVTGSDRAPLVQQAPSYGGQRSNFVPLHRYRLDERLRELDLDSARGELDPFERRKRLETRQELHELDRTREQE